MELGPIVPFRHGVCCVTGYNAITYVPISDIPHTLLYLLPYGSVAFGMIYLHVTLNFNWPSGCARTQQITEAIPASDCILECPNFLSPVHWHDSVGSHKSLGLKNEHPNFDQRDIGGYASRHDWACAVKCWLIEMLVDLPVKQVKILQSLIELLGKECRDSQLSIEPMKLMKTFFERTEID